MTDIYKCSRCKCPKMESMFEVRKNTGIRNKTCIECKVRYRCDKCDYKCSTNTLLKQHIKQVHDKIKNFECSRCDYKCSDNSNLQKHIKQVHDKIKDVECPKCDYKCSTNSTLLEHIKQVHDKIKDIECSLCAYKCSKNSILKTHIKQVHHKIKDFECSQCDAKFSTNDHLKIHIKMVHDKIKDVECPKCDFKCSYNGNLQRHIKAVHDKIKDFECDLCDFKCSAKGDLQKHIVICTGDRNISGGEFEVINNLKKLGLIEDIDYIFNSSFSELTDYAKRPLRFDFKFINHKIVIEFDGKQHTEPIRFGGVSREKADENFNTIKLCDKLKDEFCRENDYKMIRISYLEFPNILTILHRELINLVNLD